MQLMGWDTSKNITVQSINNMLNDLVIAIDSYILCHYVGGIYCNVSIQQIYTGEKFQVHDYCKKKNEKGSI